MDSHVFIRVTEFSCRKSVKNKLFIVVGSSMQSLNLLGEVLVCHFYMGYQGGGFGVNPSIADLPAVHIWNLLLFVSSSLSYSSAIIRFSFNGSLCHFRKKKSFAQVPVFPNMWIMSVSTFFHSSLSNPHPICPKLTSVIPCSSMWLFILHRLFCEFW